MASIAAAEQIIAGLKEAGIDLVSSVPDINVLHLINLLYEDKQITHVPVGREEEGVGVCAGAHLGGKKTALLMQNGGLLNSCNGLTTTALQFGIPILLLIYYAGDIGDKDFCERSVRRTIDELGRLDVLVNNAGEQHPDKDIRDITGEQLRRTFQTNVFGMFFMTQAAIAHLQEGSAIINCTSETMYAGSPDLLDYSATKGAITAFTRSLAKNLVKKGIRVNAVAPGPIWTPLNTFGGQPPEDVPEFGKDTPMGRPGQPNEVAPSFLFLACEDSSYMTGQVLHPDGGDTTSS